MNYYQQECDQHDSLIIWNENSRVTERHFHHNFEMIYLVKGEIDATYNGIPFTMEENQIFVIHSFFSHSLASTEDSSYIAVIIPDFLMSEFNALFRSKHFRHLLTDISFNKNQILPFLQNFSQNRNAENLDTVTNDWENKHVQKGCASIILGKLLSKYPLTYNYSYNADNTLISVLQFIDENYTRDITLNDISDHLGYNKYYISKLFNKSIGQNMRSYINNLRLQKLLHLQNDPLYDNTAFFDIIRKCGFNNLSSYYRYMNKLSDRIVITKNNMQADEEQTNRRRTCE